MRQQVYYLLLLAAKDIWPPCVRVTVVRSPVLQVGTLFIITADAPASIGRLVTTCSPRDGLKPPHREKERRERVERVRDSVFK